MRPLSLLALLLALAAVAMVARNQLQGVAPATTAGQGATSPAGQAEAVRQSLEGSLDQASERLNRGIEQAGAN